MPRSTHTSLAHIFLVIPLVFTGVGGAAQPVFAQGNAYHADTQRKAYKASKQRKHACSNRKKKKRNKILGALGGAAIGGFVGRKVDGGNHREAGTIAGAVGGAVVGQAIAGKLSSCDRYLQDEAAVRSIQSGHAQDWSNNDSGYGGSTERAQTFIASDGRECNTIVTTTSDQNGAYDPQTIILCKNNDGSWSRM